MDLTPQMADYLKSIYMLQDTHEQVPTTALAERLGVTPPSVTGMVHKLADLGLLDHEPYKGVRLTEEGEALAVQVVRAHRLWEAYLVEALGLPWDEAHVEAERLEHVLSERVAERLDAALSHPTLDPHGHPIPGPNGQVIEVGGEPLTDLPVGGQAVVVQIRDETAALLRYLGELGIYPGERIILEEVAPFEGPIHLRVQGEQRVIGYRAAAHILVRRVPAAGEGT